MHEIQTVLKEIQHHTCRICDKYYSIYGINGLCFDCDIGLNIGVWGFEKWSKSFITEEKGDCF